jgi:hypothetical protein
MVYGLRKEYEAYKGNKTMLEKKLDGMQIKMTAHRALRVCGRLNLRS